MNSVTKNKPTLSVTHGYARCSTSEEKQDIDRQVRELKRAGADRVWLEYEHGDSPNKEQQELLCKGWSHHLIHMTAVHLWQNGTLQL